MQRVMVSRISKTTKLMKEDFKLKKKQKRIGIQ